MNGAFRIIDKFVVHQGEEPSLFPGLTLATNGELLISFCTRFDCLSGGEAYLLRSCDDGRTWPEPESLLRSRKADGCINLSVGLSTLRDGPVLDPCCDARTSRNRAQPEVAAILLRP